MAAKRRAGSQLTQDNWQDEEEEDEVVEVGTFKVADASVLSKRKIMTARRRMGASANNNKPSPFGGFKGFSGTSSSSTNKPAFGSGFQVSSSQPSTLSTTLGVGLKPADSSSIFSLGNQATKPQASVNTALNGGTTSATTNSSSEYCAKLKSLNLAVSSWIQQHVSKTPVCDLTPIFNDYSKHLAEIEEKYGSKSSASASSSVPFGSSDVKSLSTGEADQKTESKPAPSQFTGFSFGSGSSAVKIGEGDDKKESSIFKTSTEGSKLTFGTSSTAFGSSTGQGFTFPGVSVASTEKKEEKKEDTNGEDEPPKVEFKQVEEKDAIFSIRSKLYYKKDGQYKEKGVGMLHLKQTDGVGQILLRADTSLGNIILNIGIPKALPVQRQGKNSVILMAPMNPPVDTACPKCNKKYENPQSSNACENNCTPEICALLLRVKTGDDADKLLEEITKLKE